jgi:hypothetical protein
MTRKYDKITPVSPGKKPPRSGRIYSTYDQKYQAQPEQVAKRVERNAARREALKEGRVHKGDGKDVHHVAGVASKDDRVKIVSAKTNRSKK